MARKRQAPISDDRIQYLVIVAKIDLDELSSDVNAEAFDAVDIEWEDDNDDPLSQEPAGFWFDESYCSAELDEKLRELYGKGLVGGGANVVTRGDYLLAGASRFKAKDAIRNYLRKRLYIR